MLVFEQFIGTIVADCREFMSGIGTDNVSGRNRQNSDPDGNKHICLIIFIELVIDAGQNFCRGTAAQSCVFDHGSGNHHKQRGRDSLTGYIRNDHGKMIRIN